MKPYVLRTRTSEGFDQRDQLDDPFVHTTVVLGWNLWDWFRMVFKRKREVIVKLNLSANTPAAIRRVMNALHEDCAACGTGDTDSHEDHSGDTKREVYVGGESNG